MSRQLSRVKKKEREVTVNSYLWVGLESTQYPANGPARVYGTRVTLWDGGMSKDYVKKLEAVEVEAKNRAVGGLNR